MFFALIEQKKEDQAQQGQGRAKFELLAEVLGRKLGELVEDQSNA
jgi:hypothetical protein